MLLAGVPKMIVQHSVDGASAVSLGYAGVGEICADEPLSAVPRSTARIYEDSPDSGPASDPHCTFRLQGNYAAVPLAVKELSVGFSREHSLYLIGAQR